MTASSNRSNRGEGRARLIQAASEEFELHGYEGTHSNAIAIRAGYAPQTFYRHFEDKLAIFLAVYENWYGQELVALSKTRGEKQLAVTLIHHHRKFRAFRRSLRMLTTQDPRVADARAVSRTLQIRELASRSSVFALWQPAQQAAFIFSLERLADAIVDEEFSALGIGTRQAARTIEEQIGQLRLGSARL